MSTAALNLSSHRPANFADRGLCVPFTTPLLAGARVRSANRPGAPDPGDERRGVAPGIELIVPNPGGGRGVYILRWENRRALCCATVHDTQLGAALELKLQMAGGLSPALVRRVAHEVAAEGYAGRAAARAAVAALDRASRRRASAQRRLLTRLIRQVEGPGCAPPELDGGDVLDWRALSCLERLGAGLSGGAAGLAAALAEVGEPAAELAVGADGEEAPTERVLREVAALQAALHEAGHWAQTDPSRARAPAVVLAAAAELVRAIAGRLLPAVQRRLDDVPLLLHAWTRAPATVAAELARPAWLLDGWERICLVWLAAGSKPDRLAALSEMSALIPFIPAEADSWLEMTAGTLSRAAASVPHAEPIPARPRSTLERIAENERLRAMIA